MMLGTLLATVDLLAVPVAMNFSGRERAKTKFGGLCSLIFFAFFFWTIIKGLQDFFSTNNPHIINSDSYTQDPKETIITSDSFPMAFQMRTPVSLDYTPYIDEKIYDLRAFHTILERITHPNGTIEEKWFEEELATEKCTLEHFGDIATSFADVNLNFTFCLARNQTIDKLSLQGAFISPIYKTITIRVYQCRNTTTVKNCYPQEIINDYLGGSWFSTIFSNMVVNPKDYAHPNLRYRDQYYTMVHPNNYRETEIELGHVEISTDNGILGESLETNTYVKVNKVTEFIQFDSNPEGIVISCIFQLSKLENYYSRVYKKLTEIISEAGSLANTALVILLLVTTPYFRLKFRETLMNELFDIKLPQNQNTNSKNFDFKKNKSKIRNKKDKKKINQMNKPTSELTEEESPHYYGSKNKAIGLDIESKSKNNDNNNKIELCSVQTDNCAINDSASKTKNNEGETQKADSILPYSAKRNSLKFSVASNDRANEVKREHKNNLKSTGSPLFSPIQDHKKNIKSTESSLFSPINENDKESNFKRTLTSHLEKSSPVELKHFGDSIPENPNFSFEAANEFMTKRQVPQVTLIEEEEIKPEEIEERGLTVEQDLVASEKDKWESQSNSADSPDLKKKINTKETTKIDLNFWEFACSFVYRPPNLRKKLDVLQKGSKNIIERLDVTNMLKKLREIDKLIVLLLDQDQLTLFNNLPKPEITYGGNQNLLRANSISKLRASKFTEDHVSEERIFDSYMRLKNKPKKTKIDEKLLEIFNETNL